MSGTPDNSFPQSHADLEALTNTAAQGMNVAPGMAKMKDPTKGKNSWK